MLKYFFIIFIFCFCLINCKPDNIQKSKQELSENPKEKVQLTGIINVTDEDYIYLIVNWKSRSRKTYEIIGKNREEFRNLKDKVITAECEMVEERYWSGKIKILNYKIVE